MLFCERSGDFLLERIAGFVFNISFAKGKDLPMNNKKKMHVHIPYPMLLERFDEVLRERINPEIYMDGECLVSAEAADLKEIQSGIAVEGLELTIHGPYAELNPGSLDERVRLLTVERYHLAFRIASYLKPKAMVLHGGYSERKFKGDIQGWLDKSLKTWPQFIREAERLSMVIAVENIFDKDPLALRSLMEKIPSPRLGICIDSGHLNVFSAVPMEEWFKSLGPYVAEVHMHDNKGAGDEHLPIGEGAIDFRLFLGYISAYCPVPIFTIEPHGEEMLKRGIKAAEELLKEYP